jgi:hypothetical protein
MDDFPGPAFSLWPGFGLPVYPLLFGLCQGCDHPARGADGFVAGGAPDLPVSSVGWLWS